MSWKPSISTRQWAKGPANFVRMIVCLDLHNLRYTDSPNTSQHADLIDKVVQHRHNVAESRAAQPALITAGGVQDVLLEFSGDPFSSHARKRWLLDVLSSPKQNRQDPEYLLQTVKQQTNSCRTYLATCRLVSRFQNLGSLPYHSNRLEDKEPWTHVLGSDSPHASQ